MKIWRSSDPQRLVPDFWMFTWCFSSPEVTLISRNKSLVSPPRLVPTFHLKNCFLPTCPSPCLFSIGYHFVSWEMKMFNLNHQDGCLRKHLLMRFRPWNRIRFLNAVYWNTIWINPTYRGKNIFFLIFS